MLSLRVACKGNKNGDRIIYEVISDGTSQTWPRQEITMSDKTHELFIWTTPNGYKVLLFAEEAGIPYTIKAVNISKG